MKYSVGELIDPRASDPDFTTEEDAIEAARALASDAFNTPFAVWEMKGCTVTRIFYDGEEFSRR